MAAYIWTFPGVLQNNVFRSDPVTNSDEIGQFFYLSLQSDVNRPFFATICGALQTAANTGGAIARQRRRRRRQAVVYHR